MQRLTRTEEEIMRVVWNSEDETISMTDLLEELRKTKRESYARTTLVTLIGKIIEKGYATTIRKGKSAYVCSKVKLEEYKVFVMNDMVDTLYKGDYEAAKHVIVEIQNQKHFAKREYINESAAAV